MSKNEWILHVVRSFYEKAKVDVLIGYHFRVIKDFDEHIPRIATFWEIQLLGKGGHPLQEKFDIPKVHLSLGIKRGEVGRWLLLFRRTLDEATEAYPEFKELRHLWEEKLIFFEGVFLRFLGL